MFLQLIALFAFSSDLILLIDSQNTAGQDCKPFHQIYGTYCVILLSGGVDVGMMLR